MTAIFCDESGGTAPAESRFLTVAVRIDPDAAVRFVRKFRKAAGVTANEVHGNALSLRQRRILVDMLARGPAVAVSVVCHRNVGMGGYLMAVHPEIQIWRTLLVECCSPLISGDVRTVVPDGGRYSKKLLAESETAIRDLLASSTGFRGKVHCTQSTKSPGIQLADALGNIINRSLGDGDGAEPYRELVRQLKEAKCLTMRDVQASALLPEWAEAAQ